MKIESINTSTQIISKMHTGQGQAFEKGQTLNGKIMAVNGEVLDILLSSGAHIKATSQGSIDLPLNVRLSFEVIENTSSMLLLKPTASNLQIPASRERIMFGLASELGIKQTPGNISFIDTYSRTLCKNIELLSDMLLQSGNTKAFQSLQGILISPEKLGEYLKSFNDESMMQLVNKLDELFNQIKNGSPSSKEYTKILSDIVKSFSMQINHEFPLYFIPVPLIFNNKFYPGEIWIEKEPPKEQAEGEQLSAYVILDTPSFGRIEGLIRSHAADISVDLFCKKEIMSIFSDNIGILKDKLSSAGIAAKSLGIHELKRSSSFTDLAQKYVTPLPSVDLKI